MKKTITALLALAACAQAASIATFEDLKQTGESSDLFNGNGSLYEITIRRLNEFDNFDDCMIYIAEHFAWNPNTDGAKLMMELLERKFDQQ